MGASSVSDFQLSGFEPMHLHNAPANILPQAKGAGEERAKKPLPPAL